MRRVIPIASTLFVVACLRSSTEVPDSGGPQDAGLDGGDAGFDAGPDSGFDCSAHCTIDGGTYCRNQPSPDTPDQEVLNFCQICDPVADPAHWTLLPPSAACDVFTSFGSVAVLYDGIPINRGRGYCSRPEFNPEKELCTCEAPSQECMSTTECCTGVCDQGHCRIATGGTGCFVAHPLTCLSANCCPLAKDAGPGIGICGDDAGGCPLGQ